MNFVLMAAAISVGVSAHAASVRDQFAATPVGGSGGQQIALPGNPFNTGYSEAGQVVTVGLAGLLTSVDVAVNGFQPGTTTLRIRAMPGGILASSNDNILASVVFDTPVWTPTVGIYSTSNIDVSGFGLIFSSGDQFALTFDTAETKFFGWAFSPDTYAGGGSLSRTGPTNAWQTGGADVGFATYVDTSFAAAVPEPASWAMLIAGFGLIGAVARRRAAMPIRAA